MQKMPIYLDYNATTPVAPEVLEAMLPYFSEHFGNAASKTHAYGWVAEEVVEKARLQVASLLNATAQEIVFTSGATEGVNTALKGIFEAYRSKGNHIITVNTEHKAVLDTCQYLEQQGAEVTYLPVYHNGLLDLDNYKAAFKPNTILAAVMYANNETGVIQPIKALGEIAHEHNTLFFSDATQAVGKIEMDVLYDNIDILALSAHKFYGPKGIGALYIRRKNPRATILPLLHGGGHERGFRSGTLNVPAIVGLGKACELAQTDMWNTSQKTSVLRTKLEHAIEDLGNVYVNGNQRNRLSHVTNLAIMGINANELLKLTPELAFSTGSACTSALQSPSHVLKAMQLSDEMAKASIRLSLGKYTTDAEIDQTIQVLSTAIKQLRKL